MTGSEIKEVLVTGYMLWTRSRLGTEASRVAGFVMWYGIKEMNHRPLPEVFAAMALMSADDLESWYTRFLIERTKP